MDNKQAMGYILRAFLDVGTNTKELRSIFSELMGVINKEYGIDNYDIIDYAKKLKLEKDHSGVITAMYNGFDLYTIEEAGGFYEAFKVVLRV